MAFPAPSVAYEVSGFGEKKSRPEVEELQGDRNGEMQIRCEGWDLDRYRKGEGNGLPNVPWWLQIGILRGGPLGQTPYARR